MVDGEVGGGHSEAQGVGDVLNRLDDSVGINIAVGSAGHSIGRLDLGFSLQIRQ